jgi:hypothetical protein
MVTNCPVGFAYSDKPLEVAAQLRFVGFTYSDKPTLYCDKILPETGPPVKARGHGGAAALSVGDKG